MMTWIKGVGLALFVAVAAFLFIRISFGPQRSPTMNAQRPAGSELAAQVPVAQIQLSAATDERRPAPSRRAPIDDADAPVPPSPQSAGAPTHQPPLSRLATTNVVMTRDTSDRGRGTALSA